MSGQETLERRLAEHLAREAPGQAPGWVLTRALTTIDMTSQRRAARLRWRDPPMLTYLRFALIAAVLASIALGGWFAGSLPQIEQPAPSLGPPVPLLEPEPIGAAPDGMWRAVRPAVFGLPSGDYLLHVGDSDMLTVTAPGERALLLGRVQGEGNTVHLGATDQCPSVGTYTWLLAEDYRTLSVTEAADTCADRIAVLAGSWSRQGLSRVLRPGRPYLAETEPAVVFTIPTGFVSTSTGGPPQVTEIHEADHELVVLDGEDLFAWIQPGGRVLRDRCDIAAGIREPLSSMAEFIEWNESTTGALISTPVATTVGGHPAVRLDVTGTSDCPNGVPAPDCFCMPFGFVAGGGFEERIWGVDIDGRIAVVGFLDDNPPWTPNTPERLAIAQRLVDSIEFR